ncbi:hypothetical protein KIPB_005377 [Kipferlia bialata]|uniref:Uncharacterized protein n=1 Tax=Kipferlia bialata TaxID=797122 RepID=A0A391P2I9_9EUKA|nr:hypothetical protein KIPB_005377 [Kipferlia bialata]|eukprot:g5377.t1
MYPQGGYGQSYPQQQQQPDLYGQGQPDMFEQEPDPYQQEQDYLREQQQQQGQPQYSTSYGAPSKAPGQ